jgi:hypothetical protein
VETFSAMLPIQVPTPSRPRPRPGVLPFVLAATEAEKHRLKALIAEGNAVDAVARLLVYVGKAQHRVEESTFEALRNLLLAHPEVSEAEFKAAVRERWAILAIDERAGIETPQGCQIASRFFQTLSRQPRRRPASLMPMATSFEQGLAFADG